MVEPKDRLPLRLVLLGDGSLRSAWLSARSLWFHLRSGLALAPCPVRVPRRARGLRFELLEDRTLRSADGLSALLPHEVLAAATDLGIAPGLHRDQLNIDPGADAWYRFQLLRGDSVDVKLTLPGGDLDLEVTDFAGQVLGSGDASSGSLTLTLDGLAAGTYYVHARAGGDSSGTGSLDIVPASSSTTTVYYINDADTVGDGYTRAPGDDVNTGLSPDAPMASLQGLLDRYIIGSHDLILIDTGIYSTPLTITADDQGAAYIGSPAGSSFAGAGIEVSGADGNLIYGLRFTGGNVIGLDLHPADADDARNNVIGPATFTGMNIAIRIQGGADNVVQDTTIASAGFFGISLSEGAAALVRHSAISGATHAIHVAGADLIAEDNDISQSRYGIYFDSGTLTATGNTIAGCTAAGILAVSGHAAIAGNTLHDNATGLEGVGDFGGTSWDAGQFNDIFSNDVGVRAHPGAAVAFNRIHGNAIGIHTGSATDLQHNVIYRNTTGILVDGGDGVSITSNTVYASRGDAVRIANGSANVSLRNNILWTEDGYDLHVASDSQAGLTSDYNNLYATADGKLVFFQKDFTDLFNWQMEANFDRHSIGYTSLNPLLDDPLFVNLVDDDYHLSDIVSTSRDAGDPASDYALESGINGGRIDLGAYGNTAQAGQSPAAYIKLLAPTFYTDWTADVAHAILWRTFDVSTEDLQLAGKVSIDLTRDGTSVVSTLSTMPASTGSYLWTPASSGINGDAGKRYRVRVSSVDNAALSDSSREAFAVPGAGTNYYVNDFIVSNNQYTSAPGNNRSTGKTPADPKANLLSILAAYDLKRGDTIFIDTGSYLEVRNVIVSGSVGDDAGVTITGPTAAGKTATLDRGNTAQNTAVIEVDDGDSVTIKALTLTGAQTGLWVHHGSAAFTGSRLTATLNTLEGFKIESDSAFSISDSTANGNFYGFYLSGAGAGRLENNIAYGNDTSISVHNSGPTPTVIGNANLSKGRGNRIYNNASAGISASGNVQVVGNTVFGQSSPGQTGILVSSATSGTLVRNNVVFNNYDGIALLLSGVADGNRVYHNSRYGVRANGAVVVRNNVVYSNDIGIFASGVGGFAGVVANNLVYANTTAGVVIADAGGAWLVNNTIYQLLGDAVRVQDNSTKVSLRNNVLSVESGYAINVDADSLDRFTSDYNDLYKTGTGKVGLWAGSVRGTLLSWRTAANNDRNSLSVDPLFADADGSDSALGFADFSNDGRDDDFHEQSIYGSYHGGSFAPVVNAVTGLPVTLTGTWTVDQNQSAIIDHGSAVGGPYSNKGGAINLGAYGNTSQASRSAPAQVPISIASHAPVDVVLAQNLSSPASAVGAPPATAASGDDSEGTILTSDIDVDTSAPDEVAGGDGLPPESEADANMPEDAIEAARLVSAADGGLGLERGFVVDSGQATTVLGSLQASNIAVLAVVGSEADAPAPQEYLANVSGDEPFPGSFAMTDDTTPRSPRAEQDSDPTHSANASADMPAQPSNRFAPEDETTTFAVPTWMGNTSAEYQGHDWMRPLLFCFMVSAMHAAMPTYRHTRV